MLIDSTEALPEICTRVVAKGSRDREDLFESENSKARKLRRFRALRIRLPSGRLSGQR